MMARTRYTFRPKGSSEWMEKSKPGHSQNNPEDTYQEKHSDAHHVNLSGKPDHIRVDSDDNEEELLSEEEEISESSEDDNDNEDYNKFNNEHNKDNEEEDYLQEEAVQQVHIKGTYSGKPISSNDSEPKTSRAISESRMGEPKIADLVIKHLYRSKWTTQSKLRKDQPKSTEEVEVEKNTKYTMGKPGMIMLEEGKLRKGQTDSSG